LIFIYNLLLLFLIILFSPFILIGIIINPKWRKDVLERFCIYDKEPAVEGKKTIWFHTASVGEIQALIPVLKELKNICEGYEFVITTTSINGKNKIKKELNDLILFSCFVPVDLYFFTDYFIRKIKPQLVVFIETELWPNLINNIYLKKVPLVLMNGRISEKSFIFYRVFSFIFAVILQKFMFIIVQSEKMAKRFISIGKLDNHKIIVLPNTKFSIEGNLKYKYLISKEKNKKIIIAGSIREGEEELIIKSFFNLKDKAILIVAPRYLKRVNNIIQILNKYNLKYELWTNLNECNKILDCEVVILNTIGELTHFYSMGDIAIVGGGFKNFGGHNPIEPAFYGLPVIVGKNMFNFEDTTNRLVTGGGTFVVEADVTEMTNILKLLVYNENERISKGYNNKKVVENFKSSAETTALLIKEILVDKKLYEEQK